jgi:hypothetical protein
LGGAAVAAPFSSSVAERTAKSRGESLRLPRVLTLESHGIASRIGNAGRGGPCVEDVNDIIQTIDRCHAEMSRTGSGPEPRLPVDGRRIPAVAAGTAAQGIVRCLIALVSVACEQNDTPVSSASSSGEDAAAADLVAGDHDASSPSDATSLADAAAAAISRAGNTSSPGRISEGDATKASQSSALDGATMHEAGEPPFVVADAPTENTLIIVGWGSDFRLGPLAVDDQWLYWAQAGGLLVRAKKDGSDEPSRFAAWGGTLLGQTIRITQDYVYWLDNGFLMRQAKDVGATAESITLPWTVGNEIAVHAGYVYVAAAGCAAIVRVDETTLEQDVAYPEETFPYGTGLTYIKWVDDTLYCGAWTRVFRQTTWSEPLEELVNNATGIGGIAPTSAGLFYLDQMDRMVSMWRVEGGSGVLYSEADVGTSLELTVDEPRRRVLWASVGAAIEYFWESKTWNLIQHTQTGRGLTTDEAYIYWTRDGEIKTIERKALASP